MAKKYKGRIKNITTNQWLTDETDGVAAFSELKRDACIFNDEFDANATLELLNDRYEDCFTLFDNK